MSDTDARGPGGVEDLLGRWIEPGRNGEAEAPAPARSRAAPEPAEPPRPGIVPPNGPLPRRFGPSWYSLWGARIAAMAAFASAYLFRLGDLLEGRGTILALGAVVVLVLVGVVAWMRRRDEVEALAVLFEPAGITVQMRLFTRHFPWGSLVGLRPPRGESGGWGVEANVDGRTVLIRLPKEKAWASAMIDALRGRAEHVDKRFERPAGQEARAAHTP